MEATPKEREMVEAAEAQATAKGSHVIVKRGYQRDSSL